MAVETYTADALKKIKGLISDMIAKLEKKAKADAKFRKQEGSELTAHSLQWITH